MTAPAGAFRDRATTRGPAQTAWALGYVLVGIALATAAAWPLYASARMLVVGVVGGVLGMAVAVLARRWRWSVPIGGLAAAATYLLVAVPLAVPGALRSVRSALSGLRDAVLGVVVGWKQLLTLSPPLGEYQAVLIPFLVVILFGSFLATVFALSPRRRALWAVPIVVAMSVFGIAFGASEPSASVAVWGISIPAPREWMLGVGVFAASLTWVIGRARLERARALRAAAGANVSRRSTPALLSVRRHLLSGALVLVAVIAGIAVAPVAAGWGDREVLRDDVEPMVVVQQQPSPLSAYRGWFADDRFGEAVVRLGGDTGDLERIRMVTLDAFDGQVFHIAADERFRRLPRTAPSHADQVTLEITVGDAYQGIWVPAPAGLAEAPTFSGPRAEQLADGFHIDDAADTAITIADAPGGAQGLVPGDQYSVVIDPVVTDDDPATVQGGESTLDPALHPALIEWAELQEQPRTGAGYLELVDRLRSRGYLSHGLLDADASAWAAALEESGRYAFAPSYAGHSTARIEELFTALVDQQRRVGSDAPDAMLVSAVGDDEQFAAAAALLARHWGLESRVVIGARLTGAAEVPGIVPCTEVCTGASMSAWVEVRAGGGEWMPVDVTPQYEMLPSSITEGEQPPAHPTVPEPPRPEELDPPQAQSDSNNDAPPLDPVADDWLSMLMPVLRAVGLSALALLLLTLPVIVLLFAKRFRRAARRGAADAEDRLTGAWEELVDLYVDHGVEVDGSGTRVYRASSSGRPAAVQLAGLVDAAVFASVAPTDAQADDAWSLVAAERQALAAADGRRRTLLARLTLASFLARVRRGPARQRARRARLDTLAVTGPHGDRQKEDA